VTGNNKTPHINSPKVQSHTNKTVSCRIYTTLYTVLGNSKLNYIVSSRTWFVLFILLPRDAL